MDNVTEATKSKTSRGGRPGRKPKVPEASAAKFYIGVIKDGIPVLEKEVSEKEALLDFMKTNRPFLTIHMWKAVSELEGGKLVIVKSPA